MLESIYGQHRISNRRNHSLPGSHSRRACRASRVGAIMIRTTIIYGQSHSGRCDAMSNYAALSLVRLAVKDASMRGHIAMLSAGYTQVSAIELHNICRAVCDMMVTLYANEALMPLDQGAIQ